MELKGAISALEALKKKSDVDLWTDSNYVRQGITALLSGAADGASVSVLGTAAVAVGSGLIAWTALRRPTGEVPA